MCIWDLAIFQCGHNGGLSRRDGGCALPTLGCDKERVNAVRRYIPYNCPDCAQRLSRGIPPHPEDHMHPLDRSVQQPMFPVVSRRATARKSPPPPLRNRRDYADEEGYDFSEFAGYANYATVPQKRLSTVSPTKIAKKQRISRSKYSSDTPTMVGRLGNIAQDLSEIAMPSARERKSGIGYSPTSVRLHGTVQDVSELPPSLIPGILNTSPTRRRNERSSLLLYDAGVPKRRKASNPPRRISPTQPRAPYGTTAGATNGSTYSPNAYAGYAAASQAATRQKQTANRTYKETYDDVERMIQDGHYSREEIMATAKFAMLTRKDQEEIFWPYNKKLQARENEIKGTLEGRRMHHMKPRDHGKRDGRRKRDGCIVM